MKVKNAPIIRNKLPPFPAPIILISIYPIVSLWANKPSLPNALITAIISLAIYLSALILYYYLLSKSLAQNKATLFVICSSLFFFSYGAFSTIIEKISFGAFIFNRHMFRAPLYVMMWALLYWWLIVTHRGLDVAVKSMSAAWKVLYAFTFIKLSTLAIANTAPVTNHGNNIALTKQLSSQAEKRGYTTSYNNLRKNLRPRPDIYYIILDGYARQDTFEELYKYKHPFMDDLKKRGFFVANKSLSNYAMTVLSIPSSMDMNYLNRHEKKIPQRVKKTFIENGYIFIDIDSLSLRATLYGSSEFLITILRLSFLDVFSNRLGIYSGIARRRTLNALQQLENLSETGVGGGRFIYAHILCPHPPYVFSADGQPRPKIKWELSFNVYKTSWDDYNGYLEQTIFIGKKTIEIVDKIISRSAIPPIIVIQSDHGPKFNLQPPDNIKTCMRILNAYYFPIEFMANAYEQLYHNITPVNSFRIVLNNILGTNYPMLPDKSFYSSYSTPYNFIEVTDLANKPIYNLIHSKSVKTPIALYSCQQP